MTDPYSVLGISPDASDDEVKRAYREMARKYHPDHYQNNPLADLAEEKMKEVNAAYEQITRQRAGGGYRNQGQQAYQQGYQQAYQGGGSVYARVRQAINQGDIGTAEQLLRNVGTQDAEWHFLQGSIAYRKGWLDEARQQFQLACSMNPNNVEYRQALAMMQQGGQAYRPYGYAAGPDACDCCTTLMCMQCLCGGCR